MANPGSYRAWIGGREMRGFWEGCYDGEPWENAPFRSLLPSPFSGIVVEARGCKNLMEYAEIFSRIFLKFFSDRRKNVRNIF